MRPAWEYSGSLPATFAGWPNGDTTVRVTFPPGTVIDRPEPAVVGGATFGTFHVQTPQGGWKADCNGQIRLPVPGPQVTPPRGTTIYGRGARAQAIRAGAFPELSMQYRPLGSAMGPRMPPPPAPRGASWDPSTGAGIAGNKRFQDSGVSDATPPKRSTPPGTVFLDGKLYRAVPDESLLEDGECGNDSSSESECNLVTESSVLNDSDLSDIEIARGNKAKKAARKREQKEQLRRSLAAGAGPSSAPQALVSQEDFRSAVLQIVHGSTGADSGAAAAGKGKRQRRPGKKMMKAAQAAEGGQIDFSTVPTQSSAVSLPAGSSQPDVSGSSFELVPFKKITEYPPDQQLKVIQERNRLRAQRKRANRAKTAAGKRKNFMRHMRATVAEFRTLAEVPPQGFKAYERMYLKSFCTDAEITIGCIEMNYDAFNEQNDPLQRYWYAREFGIRHISFIMDHYWDLSRKVQLFCMPTQETIDYYLPGAGVPPLPPQWGSCPAEADDLEASDIFEVPKQRVVGAYGQLEVVVKIELRYAEVLDKCKTFVPLTIPYSIKHDVKPCLESLARIFRTAASRRIKEGYMETQKFLYTSIASHRHSFSWIYDFAPALPVVTMQMQRYKSMWNRGSPSMTDPMLYYIPLYQAMDTA